MRAAGGVPGGSRTDGFVKLVFRGDDRRFTGLILWAISLELIYLGQSVMHARDTIDRFINVRCPDSH